MILLKSKIFKTKDLKIPNIILIYIQHAQPNPLVINLQISIKTSKVQFTMTYTINICIVPEDKSKSIIGNKKKTIRVIIKGKFIQNKIKKKIHKINQIFSNFAHFNLLTSLKWLPDYIFK